MECLRAKDLDFERLRVMVREEKGDKDRITLLPTAAVEPLKRQLAEVRAAHHRAVAEGDAGFDSPADATWAHGAVAVRQRATETSSG